MYMVVSKGYKLTEIDKNKVEKTSYSDQNNLLVKFKNLDDWYFIFDEKGNKISQSEAKRRTAIELKEFLGNEDVLRFLVAQLPKETGKDNDNRH